MTCTELKYRRYILDEDFVAIHARIRKERSDAVAAALARLLGTVRHLMQSIGSRQLPS